jgi:hypothetical protein
VKALLNPWILVGLLVWTGLVGGGSYFYGHHNGVIATTTKWNAERLATANEVAERTKENAAKESRERASLSQRLRDYEAEILRASGGEAAGGLGPDAIARIAARKAETDRLYDEYDKACQRDAVRLGDVQAVIRRFQESQDAVAK